MLKWSVKRMFCVRVRRVGVYSSSRPASLSSPSSSLRWLCFLCGRVRDQHIFAMRRRRVVAICREQKKPYTTQWLSARYFGRVSPFCWCVYGMYLYAYMQTGWQTTKWVTLKFCSNSASRAIVIKTISIIRPLLICNQFDSIVSFIFSFLMLLSYEI